MLPSKTLLFKGSFKIVAGKTHDDALVKNGRKPVKSRCGLMNH